jgi:uncharacterized membrane protein
LKKGEIAVAETLTEFFRSIGLSNELVIFAISMLPILELRGGLIAAAILGVPWYIAFPVCFVANMLPIPFVLMFIRRIFKWMRKIKWLQKPIDKLEAKTRKKGEKIQKGWLIGLLLFVGIPLPGTGAWTGALAADLFDIRIRHSLPTIALGVALAGCIMLVVSYFIPGLFGF